MFIKVHLVEISTFYNVLKVDSNCTNINFDKFVRKFTSIQAIFSDELEKKIRNFPEYYAGLQDSVDFKSVTKIEFDNGEKVFALEHEDHFNSYLS